MIKFKLDSSFKNKGKSVKKLRILKIKTVLLLQPQLSVNNLS